MIVLRQDQTIHSLKTLLERQEAVFDEKLKLMSAKYSQAKAINLALQVRRPVMKAELQVQIFDRAVSCHQRDMLESLTEAEGK